MKSLSEFMEDGVTCDEWSLAARVPVIDTPYPRWSYITAVVVADGWPAGARPDATELALVESFHREYMHYWYQQSGWLRSMQDTYPFDVDGGANGRFLIKKTEGWQYRQRTWTQGSLFAPTSPLPLIELLDRINSICGEPVRHWVEWKAAHPEVFGDPGTVTA